VARLREQHAAEAAALRAELEGLRLELAGTEPRARVEAAEEGLARERAEVGPLWEEPA
jgi:hypothetical protein